MEHHSDIAIGAEIIDDKYTEDILRRRYSNFKASYLVDKELKTMGLNIRHQNTPEDITENITKFIILNYEKDSTCVWCKGVDPKHKMTGDLYSSRYDKSTPIEVKSFTSDGPSQFGPDKKFGVLYFLDLRQWLDDKIVLWKVSLNHTSSEFLNIQVNKKQTMAEQLKKEEDHTSDGTNCIPKSVPFVKKSLKAPLRTSLRLSQWLITPTTPRFYWQSTRQLAPKPRCLPMNTIWTQTGVAVGSPGQTPEG